MTTAVVDSLGTAAPPAREGPRSGVMHGRSTDADLTRQILSPVWSGAGLWWWALLLASSVGVVGLTGLIAYVLATGVGVWGNNIPVAWAFDIINFVWWIGIGHAGTFISAFLWLLNQNWRVSINRITETMTLIAVVNAGLFPLLHLGRPWFAYWLIPYPSAVLQMWPQFRSALTWDVVGVSAYLVVSLLFWYLGLIPDFAAVRDRAPGRRRRMIYGVLALGWRGSGTQWNQRRTAYTLLAGLITTLVISVESIVALDFATSQTAGWHSTIYPPYFFVSALLSGFSLGLLLLIPVRHVYRLQAIVTERHLDAMAKLLLTLGSLVAYGHIVEVFTEWYSGNDAERYLALVGRPTGPYAPVYWFVIASTMLLPQIFWVRRLRTRVPVLLVASAAILAGCWGEHFVEIVGSLNRGDLPSSWHLYTPTWVDWGILAGTLSLFLFCFLLFLRFVPQVSIDDVKLLRHDLDTEGEVPRLRTA